MRTDFTGYNLNFMHSTLTGLLTLFWLPDAFQSGYQECCILHEMPEMKTFICTPRQKMWVSTGCHTELVRPIGQWKLAKALCRWNCTRNCSSLLQVMAVLPEYENGEETFIIQRTAFSFVINIFCQFFVGVIFILAPMIGIYKFLQKTEETWAFYSNRS